MQLRCTDCGKEFDFSEGEQKFYKEKQFEPPKRCYICRKAKRNNNIDRQKQWNK